MFVDPFSNFLDFQVFKDEQRCLLRETFFHIKYMQVVIQIFNIFFYLIELLISPQE